MQDIGKFLSLMYREQRDLLLGLFGRGKTKPWMRYREIEVVEEVLVRTQPISCLEWGAGHSTLHFPRFIGSNASWVSVEHREDWALSIRAAGPGPGVTIHHVAMNQIPGKDDNPDGSYDRFVDYVKFPERFAPFDFVLVDGRARVQCVSAAHELLKPGGIVILHDANRAAYHSSFEPYHHQILLLGPHATEGGIWLGSRDRSVAEFLDVERHERLWRWCRMVGRIVRC